MRESDMGRIVSVSAAPYDGWEAAAVLESLARCGATHVEPAFIVGYTEPFDETAFSEAEATRWSSLLRASGLGCHALSSHIDLGREDAVAIFLKRMDFARRLGVIGLENPGDARPNLIDVAADGIALVRQIAAPEFRLNYDSGNTESHRPDIDPVADAISALDACAHLHLKAVRRVEDGWINVALGEGNRDLEPLRAALDARPELPVGIELPLRMRRGQDAQPWRRVGKLQLQVIEGAVRSSLAWVGT